MAHAADPNPEYVRLKGEATQAFRAQRYDEAADLFRQAFEAEPRGNLLYNIGVCYEKAGNPRQAIVHYERFIDAVPGSPKRAALLRKIATLRKQLGNNVQVKVTTRPPGAVIYVNDKAEGAMGTAPLSFELLPGSYTIIAELDDHEPKSQRVELTAGQPGDVTINLVSSSRVGMLQLAIAERGAKVTVDGQVVGQSPLAEPVRLSAGDHKVSVSKPGFGEWSETVSVAVGKTSKVNVDLSGGGGSDLGGSTSSGGSNMRLYQYITMGAGVALIGAGTYTGLSASSLHTQLEDKQKNNELIASGDIDSGNSLVMMTNVFIGTGVAVLAGGLAWYLLSDETPAGLSGDTRLMMGMTEEGQAAALLTGSF